MFSCCDQARASTIGVEGWRDGEAECRESHCDGSGKSMHVRLAQISTGIFHDVRRLRGGIRGPSWMIATWCRSPGCYEKRSSICGCGSWHGMSGGNFRDVSASRVNALATRRMAVSVIGLWDGRIWPWHVGSPLAVCAGGDHVVLGHRT